MDWAKIVILCATGLILIVMVATWQRHPTACPDGYVSIYRTSGAAACAAYVVEPVK